MHLRGKDTVSIKPCTRMLTTALIRRISLVATFGASSGGLNCVLRWNSNFDASNLTPCSVLTTQNAPE